MTVCASNDNAHPPSVSQTKKRGFTLTEIAIVLGIIGLILGAIWVAAAAVYNNLRVAHANTAILQIAQGTRALYATSNSTGASGDITATLISAKAVPSDLVVGSGTAATLIDPWPSGATTVVAPSTTDSFTINMTGVPTSACINLLTAVGGQTRDPGLFAATAASGTVNSAITTASPGTLNAVTPVSAINTCGSGTATVTVSFGFGLKS